MLLCSSPGRKPAPCKGVDHLQLLWLPSVTKQSKFPSLSFQGVKRLLADSSRRVSRSNFIIQLVTKTFPWLMKISRWKFCLYICTFVHYLILSLWRVFIKSEVAKHYTFFSICIKICCSAAQLCLTLCDPMDCSTPDFPVLHHLPVFAQTHVHSWWGHSNHLVLCRPLLLLPSIFPSIRVFSNTAALYITWPKYWSFSFSISPSN